MWNEKPKSETKSEEKKKPPGLLLLLLLLFFLCGLENSQRWFDFEEKR
jgi:hypothetical protein